MLAARVYRPLITGAGLTMTKESGVKNKNKEIDKNFSATDKRRSFNRITRPFTCVDDWRQLQDQAHHKY
jgi:hypothetical protein